MASDRAFAPAHRDAAELYLKHSSDPTLTGTSLAAPLGAESRALLNLIDRTDAAVDLEDLRSVLRDLLELLYSKAQQRPG